MKRKHILMALMVVALPLFVFGQGCFIIGPPGSSGGPGELRGDLRVLWDLGGEGSCGLTDQVEITVTDVDGALASQFRKDCEAPDAIIQDLVEGTYNVRIVAYDSFGEIAYEGSRTVTVRADGQTTVDVPLN